MSYCCRTQASDTYPRSYSPHSFYARRKAIQVPGSAFYRRRKRFRGVGNGFYARRKRLRRPKSAFYQRRKRFQEAGNGFYARKTHFPALPGLFYRGRRRFSALKRGTTPPGASVHRLLSITNSGVSVWKSILRAIDGLNIRAKRLRRYELRAITSICSSRTNFSIANSKSPSAKTVYDRFASGYCFLNP